MHLMHPQPSQHIRRLPLCQPTCRDENLPRAAALACSSSAMRCALAASCSTRGLEFLTRVHPGCGLCQLSWQSGGHGSTRFEGHNQTTCRPVCLAVPDAWALHTAPRHWESH